MSKRVWKRIDLLKVNSNGETYPGEAAGTFFENRSRPADRYNRVWLHSTFNNIFPWIWGRYTRRSLPTAPPLFTYFPNGSGIFMKVSRRSFIHDRAINCYINYEVYRSAQASSLSKKWQLNVSRDQRFSFLLPFPALSHFPASPRYQAKW